MKRVLAFVCLLISFFLAVSANFSKDYEEKYSKLDGRNMTESGEVSDILYKYSKDGRRMIVYLSEGVILYMKEDGHCPKIGSKISVRGRGFIFEKATNPGQFDQRKYYEIMGINYGLYEAVIEYESSDYNHFKNALFLFKRSMSEKIEEALPQKEASIIKTMLLGEKSEMDQEIRDLYQRNGIAHVLAISGLHISLLGMGIYKLLRLLGSNIYFSSLSSLAITLLYALMCGFSPSSSRAVIMFALAMTADHIGRSYDLLTALFFAGLLILLENPLYIYHSGFVFSFGCVAGIALLMPVFTEYKNGSSKKGFLRVISSCFCMTLISLPVYLWFYYQIPIYSIFLNLLVIPVMGILVPLGLLLILSMYFCLPLASVFRVIIVGILNIFEKLALYFDSFWGHYYTPGRPKLWQICIFLGLMAMICILRKRMTQVFRYLLALLAVFLLLIRFRPSLEISLLDVGQGDAAFIRVNESSICIPGVTKSFTLLLDGGSTSEKEVGKYRILPYLKYQGTMHIDALIATHPDTDHISGLLEVINMGRTEGIKIDYLILPKIAEKLQNENYRKLVEAAKENDIELLLFLEGDGLSFGEFAMNCIWPREDYYSEDINDMSLVFEAEYDSLRMLFCADASSLVEELMLKGDSLLGFCDLESNKESIKLLKVAHHGSRYSGSEAFLDAIGVDIAAISVGLDNAYHHPHKELLERLKKTGAYVVRTDEKGAIQFTYDKRNKLKIGFYNKENN